MAYRKGHRYLLVVADHDTSNLIRAAEGRDAKTLSRFFDLLGNKGCEQIELVSAGAAEWIQRTVYDRCPNAMVCLDTFHIVQWPPTPSTRSATRSGTRPGVPTRAAWPRSSRARATPSARTPRTSPTTRRGAWPGSPKLNNPLHRAYLLKEELRLVFKLPLEEAMKLLQHWLNWACRCRNRPFVKLARTIREYVRLIETTLTHRLTNAASGP